MKVLTLYLGCLMMIAGCNNNRSDLLLYNGIIYTVNDTFGIAGAMALHDGKIAEVGSYEDLREKYRGAAEVNLLGKAVYPGFIDPHCHFYGYGLSLRICDLTGTRSVEEVIDRLKKHHGEFSASWILGRGWDQNDWKFKRFPDKYALDSVFPDLPVYLTRIDGHAAWVNSQALILAGVDAGSSVKGGQVLKDSRGTTGILLDNAMALVERHLPEIRYDEQLLALQSAERNCLAVGLTMVGDAGLDKDIVLLMDSLLKTDRLNVRIYAMLNATQENIDHFIHNGPYHAEKISVRSVKLFADGALGSRGALLLTPYSDDPDNKGIQVHSTEFLKKMSILAYNKGYQVNTHCIGDSAVRLMLRIYGDLLPERNDLRWRIEHSQVVHPDDFPLFARFGVIPSIQATHATSDMEWAGDRLGPERIRTAYAYRTLLVQNGWLANGSDFPVESVNPLYGFYAAVTRKDQKGFPPDGFQTQEALTREEALRAMTIWAARACFEETNMGSLEPGKSADFVILDRDIMKIAGNEIPDVRVLETFIDGKQVYRFHDEK
jgi:predicted amidohydrolase YtcJ